MSPLKLVSHWHYPPLAQLRGLAVPFEGHQFFAWDVTNRLYRLNAKGTLLGCELLPFSPYAGAVSADGHTLVLADKHGVAYWLGNQGNVIQQQPLPGRPLAIAINAIGQHLLASFPEREVKLFSRTGTEASTARPPVPLVHLSFGHFHKLWYGVAGQGYAAAFDDQGTEAWRCQTLYRAEGICLDRQDRLWLAAGHQGLHQFPSKNGAFLPKELLPVEAVTWLAELSALAVLSTSLVDGRTSLALLEPPGRVIAAASLSGVAEFLAAGVTGNDVIVGLADGTLLGYQLSAR